MSFNTNTLNSNTQSTLAAASDSAEEVMVSVRDISKSYILAHNRVQHTTLGEAASHWIKSPFQRSDHELFWSLRDISFEVKRGEVLGIIGRNGAGKSTLLKVLSQITSPTTGQIDLYGRVGSLLEVGTGFHPELTGRENIYLNGAILGMKKSVIEAHFNEIVEFAEVERFLDTPVKRYSSGMYVRLAFAVAAYLNPEILIVDEVLAVGDAEFQKKCIGKMSEVTQQEGRCVLFVSHNMTAISKLCTRCILLKDGQIVHDGDTETAVRLYQTMAFGPEAIEAGGTGGDYNLRGRKTASGSGGVELCHVTLRDGSGAITNSIPMGGALSVEIEVKGLKHYREGNLGFRIFSEEGQMLTEFSLGMKPPPWSHRHMHERFLLHIPRMPFVQGTYNFSVRCWGRNGALDDVEPIDKLHITEFDAYGSGFQVKGGHFTVLLDGEWKVQDASNPATQFHLTRDV